MKLQSLPLGLTSASNQAERMGRRACSPTASALLLLILLLLSLRQAQGVMSSSSKPRGWGTRGWPAVPGPAPETPAKRGEGMGEEEGIWEAAPAQTHPRVLRSLLARPST